MEDDLNFFENGRRPQLFQKWKTTSIFSKMEDDLNFFKKTKTTSIFSKNEDDLNFFQKWKTTLLFLNERQPQFLGKRKTTSIIFKWKTTSTFDQMQDYLNTGDNL